MKVFKTVSELEQDYPTLSAVQRGPPPLAVRSARPGTARLPSSFRSRGTLGICTRRAGKLYKARSRLYRSQLLQVNTRWKAIAEIFIMHFFALVFNLNFEDADEVSRRKAGKQERKNQREKSK